MCIRQRTLYRNVRVCFTFNPCLVSLGFPNICLPHCSPICPVTSQSDSLTAALRQRRLHQSTRSSFFFPFVPNLSLPASRPLTPVSFFTFIPLPHFRFPLFAPFFPLTSHRMVMYFSHPSPTSVDPNVSIRPRDHEGSIGITCCSPAENFTLYK